MSLFPCRRSAPSSLRGAMRGPLLYSIRTGQRVGLEVTYMSMNDGYPAGSIATGGNELWGRLQRCWHNQREFQVVREMKRKPLGGGYTTYHTEAFWENTSTTPDLTETFSFPHGAVYCSSSVQVCKSVHKNKSASSSQANGLLIPQRDKSVRVEHVRGGPCLSSFLKPYCTPKWRHFLPCMSWAQLLKPSLVSCTEYFMPGFLKTTFFFPEQKKKKIFNKPKLWENAS